LLPSSPRVDRDLRLLDDGVEDTPPCTFPGAEGTGSERGGSSDGAGVVVIGGGVGVARVDGAIGMAFKLTFLFCQSPCMDLLRALGPWLVVVRIINRRGSGKRGYDENGKVVPICP